MSEGFLFDFSSVVEKSKNDNKVALSKLAIKEAPKKTISGKNLVSQINQISQSVNEKLSHLRDKYEIIYTKDELHKYIDKVLENKLLSLDTETTGLNPILDKVVGMCIFTPGMKSAYVPINHINYMTKMRVAKQMSVEDCAEEFRRLENTDVKIILFNAKFDIKCIRNTLRVNLTAYFDGLIAQKILDENHKNNRLKLLHLEYCLKGEGDAFSFDDLFKGITFDLIPIDVGYIYAAHDADITYELYLYQDALLNKDENKDLKNLFYNVEMPLTNVLCDIENMGVDFDLEYCNSLSEKYKLELEENLNICNSILKENEVEIYKFVGNPNNVKLAKKLSDPINIASPEQVGILIYDILKLRKAESNGKSATEKPVGEDILSSIDHPICKAILKYRELSKLISAFLDGMSSIVNPKTGRIHANFNQYGAATGRFSSSDPKFRALM